MPPNCLIEVRNSDIHGRGAFAARKLPAGTLVGIYTGRRYSAEEVLEKDWDHGLTYLFALSDGTTVDGAEGGNATRHLNHACEPNCEATEDVGEAGQIVLSVTTTKAVPAGAELFIDYALILDATDHPSAYPCRCGTRSCRGTIAGVIDS